MKLSCPKLLLNEFGTPLFDCYTTRKVKSPLVELFVSELNLGRGESEVIALATETGIKIIIDDLKARKIAETLMLNITGTIGILLKSEDSGFIESAYNKAKELREKGFYVSDELLDEISKFKKSG